MLSVAIRFALVVLCTSAIAQAQPTRATSQLPASSDIDPKLTEELQRQEENFASAIIRKDAEELERIVAPEFTLRVADIPQSNLPRAMWMRNTLGPLKAESYRITYSTARKLADDLAVVGELHESKGTIEGRNQGCVCYGVDFWKKRDSNWQIIARYNVASDRRRERADRPIPPPTDVDPQLTETLRQLEQQLGGAAVRGFTDTKEVDRLVDSEFTLRTSDAPETSVPRALWVQAAGPYKLDSFEERYHAARKLADDLAVVSLLLTQRGSGDGRDRSGDYYVVDIWRNRGDRWQLIARYSGKNLDPVVK
jgi:hypothetical protein